MARYTIQQSNGRVLVIEETPNGNSQNLDENEFWSLVEYLKSEGILDSSSSNSYFLAPDRYAITEPTS